MALLRGELDWVVMKCLEKQRDRRYETANALARDIQRYLADEPVEARPPSAGYRFKKILRRYKGQVIAASLVLCSLLAGMAGTTWGLIEAKNQEREARRQEQLARAEAGEKEKAREAEAARAEGERLAKLEAKAKQAEAEKQKTRAVAGEKLATQRLEEVKAEHRKTEEARRVADAVRQFFQHTVLGRNNLRREAEIQAGGVYVAATENPTMRELLVRAAKELAADKIEVSFPNQPLLQAEFLCSVGETFRVVGENNLAIELLERALALQKKYIGPDHTTTTHTMSLLGSTYYHLDRVSEASSLFEHNYAFRLKQFGPHDNGTLSAMHGLGCVYITAGRFPEGIALLKKAYENEAKVVGAESPRPFAVEASGRRLSESGPAWRSNCFAGATA